MTAYWPTAAVMEYLYGYQRIELADASLGMSQLMMVACHNVTSRIPACTSLAIIASKGAGLRRVYLSYPDHAQWVALERGGFVEMWDNFGFMLDALH